MGFLVKHIEKMVEEDNYEKGALGHGKIVIDERIGREFETLEQVLKFFNKQYGLSDDPKDWYFASDGFISFSAFEDDRGEEVDTNSDLYKKFVAGEVSLWIADYSVMIDEIESHPLTQDEASKVGIRQD